MSATPIASKAGLQVAPWRRHVWLAACLLLGACTPALNWREVQLGRLSALLPCKPDAASRRVNLGGLTLPMEMVGCEAGGALYAISRLQADDPTQAALVLALLRKASRDKLAQAAVHPMPNSGDAMTSLDVQVDGRGADGRQLQARFKWLLAGQEVYQLAAYAEHLGAEQTDSLLTEARIR